MALIFISLTESWLLQALKVMDSVASITISIVQQWVKDPTDAFQQSLDSFGNALARHRS
jgi:hypothetical protein